MRILDKAMRSRFGQFSVLAVGAILVLAACSSQQPKNSEYESVNELAVAYNQVFPDNKCRSSSADINEYGWDQATCGAQTILMVFANGDKQNEVKQKNPPRTGHGLLEGKNWIIETYTDDLAKLQETLGGESD